MGWQWHELDHMQIICTSLQTDDHTSPLSFYRQNALPATQPTTSRHWRHWIRPKWCLVFYKLMTHFCQYFLHWVSYI